EQIASDGAAGNGPVARLERGLGLLVEALAGALVLADIVVLLAGVIARFVVRKPLVWSDELASMLFIWLAMLGAVTALRRGEHMRMTALVTKLQPRWQRLFEALAMCGALALLALIAWPAWEYAAEERFIPTPALEIWNLWRAAALPAGTVLMMLFSVLRLLRDRPWHPAVQAAVIVVVVIGAFALGRSVFQDLGRLNLLIF